MLKLKKITPAYFACNAQPSLFFKLEFPAVQLINACSHLSSPICDNFPLALKMSHKEVQTGIQFQKSRLSTGSLCDNNVTLTKDKVEHNTATTDEFKTVRLITKMKQNQSPLKKTYRIVKYVVGLLCECTVCCLPYHPSSLSLYMLDVCSNYLA